MPLEINLQKDIKDAVLEANGFARKLSNRFLIGIPDLFVKMLEGPASFVEVKRNQAPIVKETFTLELREMQYKFLTDAADAGVDCSVFSFIFQASQPRKVGMRVYSISEFETRRLSALTAEHQWYPVVNKHKHYGIQEQLMAHYRRNL